MASTQSGKRNLENLSIGAMVMSVSLVQRPSQLTFFGPWRAGCRLLAAFGATEVLTTRG